MSVQAHFKVTHQEADSLVYTPVLKVLTYTYEDMDGSNIVQFPIEAGTRILGVMHRVTAAINGTQQALIVGDPDDTDRYIKTGEVTPGTVGDWVFVPVTVAATAGAITTTVGQGPPVTVSATAANPTVTVTPRSRSYSTSSRLLLTFAAAATAGAGEVGILMSGTEG